MNTILTTMTAIMPKPITPPTTPPMIGASGGGSGQTKVIRIKFKRYIISIVS